MAVQTGTPAEADGGERLRSLTGLWLTLQAQQEEIRSLRAQLADRETPPTPTAGRRGWRFWRRG